MTDITDSFSHNSPLETLVRQSSRNAHTSRLQSSKSNGPGGSANHPISPLLHTRFRTSTSTGMSMDSTSMQFPDGHVYDDESVYSSVPGSPGRSPAYDTHFSYVIDAVGDNPSSPTTTTEHGRQSWASHGSDDSTRGNFYRQSTSTKHDTWQSGSDPFAFQKYESPQMQVPKVIVTSPTSSPKSSYYDPSPSRYERSHNSTAVHPSETQDQRTVFNFSRPRRPLTLEDESSDHLDHNESMRRTPTRVSSPEHQQEGEYSSNDRNLQSPSPKHYESGPSYAAFDYPQSFASDPAVTDSNSPTPTISQFNSRILSSDLHSPPSTESEHSSSTNITTSSSLGHIRLPNSPPSPRPASRVSIYSTYSFYQLEDGSRASSPASTRDPVQEIPNPEANNDQTKANPNKSRPRKPPLPTTVPSRNSNTTPDEYLVLGIQHHEANRLVESAICFERAATVSGGCGVGMLMWGLSLRHAWGTAKDEKAAFWWLRRAAEAAVGDLEAAREGTDQKAVKKELVLAIYEVGQCFFHGWGVSQDKKMAVSYFQVAARLGDADAQQELGYCFANGKGCKKDRKEAAKWYRAAAAQGASTVGLAWIYKPKYS